MGGGGGGGIAGLGGASTCIFTLTSRGYVQGQHLDLYLLMCAQHLVPADGAGEMSMVSTWPTDMVGGFSTWVCIS
jgi:hypothetical protein